MNLYNGEILSKNYGKFQTKLITEKTKQSFFNIKASSKTMKRKRKKMFHHKGNLQKSSKDNDTNVSDLSENIQIFKKYFDSKLNKTHKQLNNTINKNNNKLDYQSINTSSIFKPLTNNSLENNTPITPFTHRPTQNVVYTNYKNKCSLTLKVNKNKEPNSQIIKVTKPENSTIYNNTHANIQVSRRHSHNNSLTSEISLKYQQTKIYKKEKLRESLKKINIISKVQQYLDNRYSYKKERMKLNSQRRIIESIKETKIANHQRLESLSIRRKKRKRVTSLTECLEKEEKVKTYSPLKYNNKKEQNGIKVVVYNQGKVDQIVELFYISKDKNWNDEIEKKIDNFNCLLKDLDILKDKYSFILRKKVPNEELKLKNIDEVIQSPNEIITLDDLQKLPKKNLKIAYTVVNEELLGKHKIKIKNIQCTTNSFEIITTSIKDKNDKKEEVEAHKMNLKISHFDLNIYCDAKYTNKNNVRVQETLSVIIPQECNYSIISANALPQVMNLISKQIIIEKQISLNLTGIAPSFKKIVVPNHEILSLNYLSIKHKPTLNVTNKESIQFLADKLSNLSFDNSKTGSNVSKLSIKERIALVNAHFLMSEKEESNENLKQKEQIENKQISKSMMNIKPVAHLKKQKPAYKNFDENYSKLVEFEMQIQENKQKNVDKFKNFRNSLKKKNI